MAKPELGTKRQCRSCGNRFYDLDRDPILCPKCGATFQQSEPRGGGPAPAEREVEEEVKVDPAIAPEIVSLEDADATETEKLVPDDETETAEVASDETFLEADEEGEEDVAQLIDGDIEDDEEA